MVFHSYGKYTEYKDNEHEYQRHSEEWRLHPQISVEQAEDRVNFDVWCDEWIDRSILLI